MGFEQVHGNTLSNELGTTGVAIFSFIEEGGSSGQWNLSTAQVYVLSALSLVWGFFFFLISSFGTLGKLISLILSLLIFRNNTYFIGFL